MPSSEASPRPWSIRESTQTQQLFIVAANGLIVAVVQANSRGKKLPKVENALLIMEAVNSIKEPANATS